MPPSVCQEGSAACSRLLSKSRNKKQNSEHAQSIAEIHQPAKGEIYISRHSQQDGGKQKKGKRKFRSGFFQNRLADYDTRRASAASQAGSLGADPADRQVQAGYVDSCRRQRGNHYHVGPFVRAEDIPCRSKYCAGRNEIQRHSTERRCDTRADENETPH